MIADVEHRQDTPCQIYDHSWRPTSLQGRYTCRVCEAMGYCSSCLLTIPLGTIIMRCERHKEIKPDA